MGKAGQARATKPRASQRITDLGDAVRIPPRDHVREALLARDRAALAVRGNTKGTTTDEQFAAALSPQGTMTSGQRT